MLHDPHRGARNFIDVLTHNSSWDAHRTAFTFLPDGYTEGDRITYAQLLSRAYALSRDLAELAPPGSRLVLAMEPGLDYIVALLACMYAQLIAVPSVPVKGGGNSRKSLRLREIMRSCQPSAVLCSSSAVTELQQLGSAAAIVDASSRLRTATDNPDIRGLPPCPAGADTVALIQYTSGSTASPRGVVITHGNILHNQTLIQSVFAHTSASIIVGWLPMFHDMGLIGNILNTLYCGGRAVLIPPTAFIHKPLCWLEAISRYRATTSGGPNFAYELCVSRAAESGYGSLDLACWTVAFTGAEPIRSTTLRRFARTFAGSGFSERAWLPCYGLAEGTLIVSGNPVGSGVRVQESERDIALVSSGAPISDQQVLVVDSEKALPCADGRVGEIWVSGASVGQGYWNDTAATTQTFGARLGDFPDRTYLRTGDLGVLQGGQLFVCGRLQDRFKVRGRNFYAADIEQLAGETDPALAACGAAAVLMRENDIDQTVLIQEIPRHRAGRNLRPLSDRIRSSVLEQLELRLDVIAFAVAGVLPRTSSGKIRRSECWTLFASGALELVGEFRLPSTPLLPSQEPPPLIADAGLDRTLKGLLCKKLGIAESDCTPATRLSELGLDSLAIVTLHEQMCRELSVELPLAQFTQLQTVGELLSRLSAAVGTKRAAAAPDPKAPQTLSRGQQSLYYLQQADSGDAAYNISRAIELDSGLELGAFRAALEQLLTRHPILTHRFGSREGQPWQSQAPTPGPVLVRVDLSRLGDDALGSWLASQHLRPIDLHQDPPFRVFVLDTGRRRLLMFRIHHIVCDLWSLSVLWQELQVLYEARLRGIRATLPAAGPAYSEFVSWQETFLAAPEAAQLKAFWQEQLRAPLPRVQLPSPVLGPGESKPRVHSLELDLDAAVLRRFVDACLEHDATLFMGLLAVIYAVLARLGNQYDLIIGAPVAGRRAARWSRCVGYFVNTLPLRLSIGGQESLASLLQHVRTTLLNAYAHADYPFALIASRANAGDTDPSQMFQVMFVMQTLPAGAADFGAIIAGRDGWQLPFASASARSVCVADTTSQAPITLLASELPSGGLALSIRYRDSALDQQMAARLASYLQATIRWMPENISARIDTAPPLTPEELHEVLYRLNSTATHFGAPALLHHLLAEQTRRTPTRVALRSKAAGDLTYEQLWALSDRVAEALLERGVQREEVIAVYSNRTAEAIIGLLAILKAGAAFLPLDPEHPAERLRFMISDARVQWVLTNDPGETFALGIEAYVVDLRSLKKRPSPSEPPGSLQHARAAHPGNVAYVLYTSGSTGNPKGVAIPHEAISNRLLWMQATYGLRLSERVLHKTPASFDVSVWEIFWPLMSGATLVLAQRGAHADPAALQQLVRDFQISVMHFVPSMARMFLDSTVTTPGSLPLRLLVSSGEELTPEIVRKAREAGILSVSNQYGPTEAAIDVASWDSGSEIPAKIPIGRPIANISLYILDDRSHPAPVGAVGELHIGGRGLARGYIGQPALTAQAFLPDPYARERGARMYRTGDLARYRSDGAIEYLGRRDTQVKIHGVRIELSEIESVLMSDSTITAAAVLARAGRLLACVVPRAGALFNAADSRARARSRLPATMIPAEWITLEELPVTASGKVDRAALQHLKVPVAQPDAYCAPRDEGERLLVEIWTTVLKRDTVGIDDNFFACGGDSILTMQVAALARARGYEIPLEEIYRYQTIRLLAPRMRATGAAVEERPLEPFSLISEQDRARLPRDLADAYPMSELQQALLFHDQRISRYEIYTTSLRVQVRFERASFERAYALSIARHAMLRTSFDLECCSIPTQLVHHDAPAKVSVIDLTAVSQARQDVAVKDWLAAERRHRFDWGQPPLTRFTVHVRRPDDIQLTLSDPFLDGWSVATLITEVLVSYKQLLDREQTAKRLPLAASYADFVALERQAIAAPETKAFWKARLGGLAPARLSCKTAFGTRGHGVGRIELPVDSRTADSLRTTASTLSVPLKSLFVAAHAKVAGLFSNTDDIAFGVVCNGRPVKKDGERTLGAHLNTVPFRIGLRGRTWEQLARECFAYENQSLAHTRYPISLLQREQLGAALFDTMLNFTHFHVYKEIAASTGLRISKGYASEQTYYALTTQCHLDHDSGAMLVAFDYSDELPKELVEEFASGFLDALRAIGERRHEMHQHQVVTPHIASPSPQTSGKTVSYLERILEHGDVRPEDIAVQCQRASLSYSELIRAARNIARELEGHGVRGEDRVAIYMERSSHMVACLLATALAGAAYVPIDTTQPEARITRMLEQINPRVILADAALLDRLPGDFRCLAGDELLEQCRDKPTVSTPADPRRLSDSLAYIIFTSGSTGAPKGVAVLHGGLQNLIEWHLREYGLNRTDRVSQIASFGFDACVWEVWPALTAGTTLYIASKTTALDAEELREWLCEHRITCAFLPTPVFELLSGLDCSGMSLRQVLTGGDVLHAYPAASLPFTVTNHYGPAENTVVATSARLRAAGPHGEIPPIGRAILNNEVVLLDVCGQPARPYVLGEIHIAGASLARGYWNDPAGTAARFLPAVVGPDRGARMYRTGDLAYGVKDGVLYFAGRADAQIKLRGVRIEIGEIETALTAHSQVAQAAVSLSPDTAPGGSAELIAYVVPRNESCDAMQIRSHLRRMLPETMIPARIVAVGALPLTINGKLDRAALPVPPRTAAATAPSGLPDPTTTEIARVWESVLERSCVSMSDNFFYIGGHSLLATQIISRLRRTFGFPIPVAALFEHPTLEEFSAHVVLLGVQHAGVDRVQCALETLESLSDEEVMNLLHSAGSKDAHAGIQRALLC